VKNSMALFGIYGRHEINTCPWNNKENAKRAIEIENKQNSRSVPLWTRTHIPLDIRCRRSTSNTTICS